MANSDATAQAFAYEDGYHRQGNMFATNESVYSYAECIARRTPEGIEINENKYSPTTNRHQKAVIRAIEGRGYRPAPAQLQPNHLPEGWSLYTL